MSIDNNACPPSFAAPETTFGRHDLIHTFSEPSHSLAEKDRKFLKRTML